MEAHEYAIKWTETPRNLQNIIHLEAADQKLDKIYAKKCLPPGGGIKWEKKG